MNFEYSDKEMALFIHFDPLACQIAKLIVPDQLYNMMARQAVINPAKTKWEDVVYVESLRRCLKVFDTHEDRGKIYRMTPEWDALIDDEVLE